MNWKRRLIAAITRKKYNAFIEDTKHPEVARERLWKSEILPLLHQSAYWQPQLSTHHLDDFDVTTYEDYKESLQAAQHGHIQPFNGEELIFWSETSGTSGVRKFFPITRSFQTQFQRTMPPFIHSLTQRFPGFFKEKIVYLVAVNSNKTTPGGIPSGWISNFNYRNLPSFIKRFYAMPDEVFANTEIYEKWSGLYALATDLSAFFAVTPMVVSAFYEQCIKDFSFYLPYLLGEKEPPAPLPPLKISKKRKNHLRELSKNGYFSFKKLWPSLKFVGCWTSGLCEYPAQQLQKLLGSEIALVDGTYSATEGWVTVPVDAEPGGILHPGAHIVEFIEEGKEIHKENLIQSWELQPGKHYEVFLTTAMGLVRYQLKDIVKCTGFLNKSPRLEFCYKSQLLKLEYCAITGQELQQMIHDVSFNMEPNWFFARNSVGSRIVLVTDDTICIPESLLLQMHERLKQLNQPYAYGIVSGEVLPMISLQLPKDELLVGSHAQTKPKFISQQVIKDC